MSGFRNQFSARTDLAWTGSFMLSLQMVRAFTKLFLCYELTEVMHTGEQGTETQVIPSLKVKKTLFCIKKKRIGSASPKFPQNRTSQTPLTFIIPQKAFPFLTFSDTFLHTFLRLHYFSAELLVVSCRTEA